MDLGRATAIALPLEETERRWRSTTSQWPIMHAVLHGVSRNQMMARHKANHIQVVYARSDAKQTKRCMPRLAQRSDSGSTFHCVVSETRLLKRLIDDVRRYSPSASLGRNPCLANSLSHAVTRSLSADLNGSNGAAKRPEQMPVNSSAHLRPFR